MTTVHSARLMAYNMPKCVSVKEAIALLNQGISPKLFRIALNYGTIDCPKHEWESLVEADNTVDRYCMNCNVTESSLCD